MTREEYKAQYLKEDVEAKKRGFDRWMADPLTRVVLSSVAPTGHNEALLQLLHSAYEKGFDMGAGLTVMQLIKAATGPRP